ncbi:hypothetical protein GCM10009087_52360 [Sphingomonas oligophenolica]|uniref:Lipoprotein n=1 Tax=Sphingomonas oligophenolica TaxID=301154 RepID=A0ABU9Y6Z2_9SPHN
MIRIFVAGLMAGSAIALGGCVPMLAASAAGMAVDGVRGKPVNNEGYGSAAREACTARAQPYGAVHIIDVEHQSSSKIMVWGTVGEGKDRRSFRCAYGTKITAFKLRTIAPSQ